MSSSRQADIDHSYLDQSEFDLWATVYDDQQNPLLMLEERMALPLLPSIPGCAVLDAGCGTGRWLVRLETLQPATLMGTDSSPAMLARCREKLHRSTRLHLSQCTLLPAPVASQSLVISSFVLSYLDDLDIFASECARVIQSGGSLLLSDMHPQTAKGKGWRRSFQLDTGRTIDINFNLYSLSKIISTFEDHGFTLLQKLEPCFGAPERSLFESAGKLAAFDSLSGIPAIYILKFERKGKKEKTATPPQSRTLQINSSSYATGPSTWRSGAIQVRGDRIESLDSQETTGISVLDLSEYSLLPGLINAHDHLDFGLFPNLGRNSDKAPYQNATEWATEIHLLHADTIELHQSIPRTTRLWWGAIRNLLCGVTTVCHHNPLYDDLLQPEFPVRVVTRFGWSHSLAFDPNLAHKFQTTNRTEPFIIHAGEGIDSAAQEEIFHLDRSGLLDDRTVLIHGLALTPNALSILNRRGAALVVCPTSTQFLYGQTLSSETFTSVEKLAIGSDSSLTARGDLLDEIQFLHSNGLMEASTLYETITSSPAKILHLENGEGFVSEGGIADLIAIRGQHSTPAAALSQLTMDRVEMVLLSGRVQLASDTIYHRLPLELRTGMEVLELAGHRRWIRAPLQELFAHAEAVLGSGNLSISGRQVLYAGTV